MKHKIRLYLIASLMGFAMTGWAQKTTDPVLFTYGGKAVGKKEFLRMYTKNINNQKPDFSEKALRDYLTLYSRFKMKVSEAEQMQMDTIPSIQNELGTYKKQLAKSYLTDTEVKDKLVKEAYERMKKDVRVAHILITTPRNTEDTFFVKRKIDSLYNVLSTQKIDFGVLARQLSEDKQSAINNGDIGFINILQVVYPFENVAYNTKVNEISKPFRTIFGYHIIKKLEERPARGEIQCAQILVNVRKSDGMEGDKKGKMRADSVYQLLKQGANFEQLVEKYSDDKFSMNTKGVMASFGVGQMLPAFEDAAFALKKPGDISEPVRTDYGYHIIKLIKKIPVKAFDSVKVDLAKRIEKDGRMDIARVEFTEKVKLRLNFTEYPAALDEIINAIDDSSLIKASYRADDYKKYKKPLFTMKGAEFYQNDFANYLEPFTKGRMYGKKDATLRALYKNYVDKALTDIQENNLAVENEDYRNLLNEYRDGIMLFELTDKSVWTKASVDTNGLKKFYEQHQAKYMWGPSIKGTIYKANDEATAKLLVKAFNNPQVVNKDDVAKAMEEAGVRDKYSTDYGKFERNRFPTTLKMNAGKYCPYYKNDDGSYTLLFVDEVIDNPTQKTLTEARGYVISEYQEYLEKEWIKQLENKYPVKVNESVLKGIIK